MSIDPDLGINKTTFEQALVDYASVKLFVRQHERVVIPESVKAAWWKSAIGYVPLEYGLDMPNPIGDLKVTDEGVEAVLSFNQISYRTFVPWDAVVAVKCDGLRPPPAPVKSKPKLKLV